MTGEAPSVALKQPLVRNRTGFMFLNLGHALDHYCMLIFPTAVLAIHRAWGTDYGETLALATAGFIAFGAAALPSGWIADKWGRHNMMVVFFFGIGAATLFTGAAQTPWQLGVGLMFIGLFASIYHPVGIAMVIDTAVQPGKAIGVNGVAGNIGVALAGGITAWLTATLGWRAAFIAPGAVAICAGLAFALMASARDNGPAEGDTKAKAEPVSRADAKRILLVVAVAAVLAGLTFNSMTVALPKILVDRLAGLVTGLANVGLTVTGIFGVAAIAQLVVGHLLDRYPVRWILVAVAALQVPMLLLATTATDATMIVAATAIMLLVFGNIPITDYLVGRAAATEWRARVYALKYVLSLGVAACAVPLVAYIRDTTGGFDVLFMILATTMTGVALVAFILPRRLR